MSSQTGAFISSTNDYRKRFVQSLFWTVLIHVLSFCFNMFGDHVILRLVSGRCYKTNQQGLAAHKKIHRSDLLTLWKRMNNNIFSFKRAQILAGCEGCQTAVSSHCFGGPFSSRRSLILRNLLWINFDKRPNRRNLKARTDKKQEHKAFSCFVQKIFI